MQSRNLLRVAPSPFLFTDLKKVIIVFLSLFLLSSFSSFIPSALIPSALASKEYEAAHPGKKVYYFLNDHLGSVDKVLDSDGNIVEERDFLPYGEERVSESYSGNKAKDITDHKFTGKELDDETGLYYYGARYYDPLIGRFISQDPWEGNLMTPQTLNKYSYVVNNPVRYVDPTGEKLSDFQPYTSNLSQYENGELFGIYKGINIISGGHLTAKSENDFQCVELVKNFVRTTYNNELGGTGAAYKYGNEKVLNDTMKGHKPSSKSSFTVFKNGSRMMPKEDDIISWSGGDDGNGHVGLIVEVYFDDKLGEGKVYTLEQNWSRNNAVFYQKLTRSKDMTYTISSRSGKYEVGGWARHYNDEGSKFWGMLKDFIKPTYSTVDPTEKEAIKNPKK